MTQNGHWGFWMHPVVLYRPSGPAMGALAHRRQISKRAAMGPQNGRWGLEKSFLLREGVKNTQRGSLKFAAEGGKPLTPPKNC